jgi:hypothetical protein
LGVGSEKVEEGGVEFPLMFPYIEPENISNYVPLVLLFCLSLLLYSVPSLEFPTAPVSEEVLPPLPVLLI